MIISAALEFLSLFAKRAAFIAYVCLLYLVIFPLLAGIPFIATIIGAPFSYIFYSIPAIATGFIIANYIIIFRPKEKLGKYICMIISALTGLVSALAFLHYLVPGWEIFVFPRKVDFSSNEPILLRLYLLYAGKVALFILSSFLIFAGITMPALIYGRHVSYLLSGPQTLAPNK